MSELPMSYYANKNAWMAVEIFKEWRPLWNNELFRQKKSILLLVDNFTAHPSMDNLKNIGLQFLPQNTSLIQPTDQGIIKNLRTLYRKELVQCTVRYIEQNLATES